METFPLGPPTEILLLVLLCGLDGAVSGSEPEKLEPVGVVGGRVESGDGRSGLIELTVSVSERESSTPEVRNVVL